MLRFPDLELDARLSSALAAEKPLAEFISAANAELLSPRMVELPLGTGDALVLKDPHYDTPVLRLAFSGLVTADLPAFAHSAGSQHIGKRNVTLLLQESGYIVGPLVAQLLIQRSAAYG